MWIVKIDQVYRRDAGDDVERDVVVDDVIGADADVGSQVEITGRQEEVAGTEFRRDRLRWDSKKAPLVEEIVNFRKFSKARELVLSPSL